jgi:hypothetical protein
MDKIIKLNSKQGGPFLKGTSNNLLDFDIPGDGTYNLSSSYLNLVGTVSGLVSTQAAQLSGNVTGYPSAYKIVINHEDADRSVYNVSMIKNCRLSSEFKGGLEDIRRVDILRQNLNEYTLSTAEQKSLEYSSIRQLTYNNTVRSSVFQEIYNDGVTLSRNVAGSIKVKLSQLFELGKLQAYPAQTMGTTRVHVELHLEKFSVASFMDTSAVGYKPMEDVAGNDAGVTSTVSKAKYDNNIENSPFWVGGLAAITFTSDCDNTGNEAIATAASNTGGTVGALTLVADYNNVFVGGGMKIKITSTADDSGRAFEIIGTNLNGVEINENIAAGPNNGTIESVNYYTSITSITIDAASTGAISVGANASTVPQTSLRTITSISYDDTSGAQTLTFFSNFVYNLLPTGKSLTAVSIAPVASDDTNAVLSFSRAELVLKKLATSPKQPSQLNYMSWTTEQFSGNDETSFQRLFTLEPEAVNVLMMFPKDDLFSQNTDIQNYRLRLDNQDLMNRNVTITEPRDPLYYDCISRTLLNSGYPTSNLNEQNLNCDGDPTDGGITQADYKLTMISNPVPLTPSNKLLQVNLTSTGTGLKELVLYKQVMREINV